MFQAAHAQCGTASKAARPAAFCICTVDNALIVTNVSRQICIKIAYSIQGILTLFINTGSGGQVYIK